MYNIAIVGDVHISASVSSRKDNYFETCLMKIKEIASKCKNIVFLGDVFNTPTIPYNYFAEFYNTLVTLKYNGNKFYSIIGNHDIYNEREESLDKTSLGLANTTGLIELITVDNPVVIDGYTFKTSYVNFEKAKEHIKELQCSSKDVLLLHHFFEDNFEGFTYNDLKNLGCKNIFFGHEHNAFEKGIKSYPEFNAYRCGSLLRNSAIDYNLVRHIYYYILDNSEIKIEPLECMQEAKDVFTYEAFTQDNLSKKQFLNNINDVISHYTNNISTKNTFSIESILREINTPEKSLNYIKDIYELIGERFA